MRLMLKEQAEEESEVADSVVGRAGGLDRLRALLAGRIAHATSEFGGFLSAGFGVGAGIEDENEEEEEEEEDTDAERGITCWGAA
jgi:hypothetical protein